MKSGPSPSLDLIPWAIRMAWLAKRRVPELLGAVLLAGFALLSSCSGSSDPSHAQTTRQPIYYGEPDTTRDAVVALLDVPDFQTVTGSCSGTIIQAADGFGTLLTAGHCVGEHDDTGELVLPFSPIPPGDLFVVPGFDWYQSTISFTVQDYTVHPSYQGEPGSLHDLALVRFYYGDVATPATLSPLTAAEDDLSAGDSFTLVGFGRTESTDLNTQRNQVDRDIAQLSTYSVVHSQDGGGTCLGDSGGPGLVVVDGAEKVAVVSSAIGANAGQDPCETGLGLGVRVSAYESFIQDYLGLTPEDPTCEACLVQSESGSCSEESDNCLTGTECGDYLSCSHFCQTASCAADCATQHQQGFVDYIDLLSCGCGACDLCGAGSVCEEPECGYSNVDEWCGCVSESCCAEALACTRDATCRACTTVDGFDLGCADNGPLADFQACVDGCADECAPGTTTSGTTTSGTSSGTTSGGGVDMVNWRVPTEPEAPVQDAGNEPAQMPDAGTQEPPDQDPADAGGEAGASGSQDEERETPATAGDTGCGCRLPRGGGRTPLPVVLVLGSLLACAMRHRKSPRYLTDARPLR